MCRSLWRVDGSHHSYIILASLSSSQSLERQHNRISHFLHQRSGRLPLHVLEKVYPLALAHPKRSRKLKRRHTHDTWILDIDSSLFQLTRYQQKIRSWVLAMTRSKQHDPFIEKRSWISIIIHQHPRNNIIKNKPSWRPHPKRDCPTAFKIEFKCFNPHCVRRNFHLFPIKRFWIGPLSNKNLWIYYWVQHPPHNHPHAKKKEDPRRPYPLPKWPTFVSFRMNRMTITIPCITKKKNWPNFDTKPFWKNVGLPIYDLGYIHICMLGHAGLRCIYVCVCGLSYVHDWLERMYYKARICLLWVKRGDYANDCVKIYLVISSNLVVINRCGKKKESNCRPDGNSKKTKLART